MFGKYDGAKTKVTTVKKSISEENPVVISMICPDSFDDALGVWNPTEDPGDPLYGRQHGRHAMCVIGYDDSKYGGAFEVINSWGKGWGNEGYIWIRYSDFARFVYQGLEVLKFEGSLPAPEPEPDVSLSGGIRLVKVDGNEIKAKQASQNQYRLEEALLSGSRFRLYISNSEPAYVYVLGWDQSKRITQIFPHDPLFSPALTYRNNEVAIPSEEHHIRLDDKVGKESMAIFYSKEPLDIKRIKREIEQSSAPFNTLLKSVVGGAVVPPEKVKFEANRIGFSVHHVKQSLVALILEFDHR